MATVYIAGPMRGVPDLNFPAFDAAAALGRSLGWTVISPAEIDRRFGVKPTEWTVAGGGNPEDIRPIMERDIAAIMSLRPENGDAIALLPGWPKSTGTLGEVGLGMWAKLQFLEAATFKPVRVELHGIAYREADVCRSGQEKYAGLVRVAEAVANGEL
jgi:hypothetical protein